MSLRCHPSQIFARSHIHDIRVASPGDANVPLFVRVHRCHGFNLTAIEIYFAFGEING